MIKLLPTAARCTIMARITALIAVSLWFSGCSTTRDSTIAINEAGTLPAPIPVQGLPFAFLHQQLTGNFTGDESTRNRQIQVLVERQGNTLQFAALASAGLQLYKLSYNGSELQATKSLLLPATFSPWRIISDFMALYADTATLSSAIASKGWTVEQPSKERTGTPAQTWQRIIKNAEGQPILSVQCSGNNAQSCYRQATLQNLQLNYELTVNTLAYEHNNNAQQGGSQQRPAQPEHHAQRHNALGGVGRIAQRSLPRSSQR